MRIRKSLYFIGLLILLPLASHTQELNVQAGPELFLPVGASSSFYSAGAGGAVSTQLELLGFLSPTLETGVTAQVLPGLGDAVAFSRIGGGVDFFLYPISRLRLSAGGRAGAYIFSYNNSALGYYWDVHAQAGFRFSPAFTLNAGAGYRQYRVTPGNADETETAADSDPFDPLVLSGISVTIGAKIQLSSLGNRSSGVTIENINQTPVFPIIYSLYDSTPLGSVTLINQEQAEIRNVKVELSAGSYTSREIVCGEFPILRKGESAEVPLYALFNEGVLAFTENTKLQADLTVKYDLLNAPQEKVLPVTISLKNRNAATWADDRIVAAFISPNDPVVLEYSKFVAGLVREHIRPGINANLQYGIGLFEGLRLSDVSFTPDPSTPYQTTRTDSSLTDYIQYPYQTIAYKGGDRDDLGILYAAALESVGIPAAIIPVESEFLVAVSLGMNENEAKRTFQFSDDLIFYENTAWVPVQVSLIREGFMRAWLEGARSWNDYSASDSAPPFYPVLDAWEKYPSVGIAGESTEVERPLVSLVENAFESALYRFIRREIDPQVQALQDRLNDDNNDRTSRVHNRLGILYAQYGLLTEASEQFTLAVDGGFTSALVNLGNTAYLQGDYEAAVEHFNKALEYRPDSHAALIGLARAKYELDVFIEVDELYQKIKEIDPSLADRYSYLSSKIEGSVSRASSAANRKGDVFWDEGE